jgi:hypothetical protein
MRVDGNIVEDMRKKQLIRHGHLKGMEEEHLRKLLPEWHAEGRRRWGRPRTTWKQDIVTSVAERNLQEGGWMDRERWNTLETVLKDATNRMKMIFWETRSVSGRNYWLYPKHGQISIAVFDIQSE